jgi:hypothetical protein
MWPLDREPEPLLVFGGDGPSAGVGAVVGGDDEVKHLLRPWMGEMRLPSDGQRNYYSSSSSSGSGSGSGWAGLVLVLIAAALLVWLVAALGSRSCGIVKPKSESYVSIPQMVGARSGSVHGRLV